MTNKNLYSYKKLLLLWDRFVLSIIRRTSAFRFRIRLNNCGKNLIVDRNVCIVNPNNVSVGDNVTINRNVIIQGSCCSVIIGSNVVISYSTHILTSNLDYHNFNEHSYKDVIIGNNVWLSSNVIVLPGVNISDNVVVAAGAVVTENLESGFIYAGVPAKKIKRIEKC